MTTALERRPVDVNVESKAHPLTTSASVSSPSSTFRVMYDELIQNLEVVPESFEEQDDEVAVTCGNSLGIQTFDKDLTPVKAEERKREQTITVLLR